MSGVIEGGWGFVWAAYGLTAAVFILYTASVVTRYRRERNRPGSTEE
ncbi:MAG TPA: heme exporter protein CcmD [Thermoanaerobaculia bacterium]|nr:heme exporter protein CcmD [Thermoanaerobaculia bacterium]